MNILFKRSFKIIRLIFAFLLLHTASISAIDDPIINKILYNKTLISFNESVFINIFFNPMDVQEVIIFFNDQQISKLNKNLQIPDNEEDKNFLPSVNFTVTKVKSENNLSIFVVLSHGITVSSKVKLYFNQGIIVDNENLQISTNKIFFLTAGNQDSTEIDYLLKIENNEVVLLQNKMIYENNVYFKLKSIKSGMTRLLIYKLESEEFDNKPIKMIQVNVGTYSAY